MISSAQDINLLLHEIELELQDIDLDPPDLPGSNQSSFPAWVESVMLPLFDKVISKYGDLPQNYLENHPHQFMVTPADQLSRQSPLEQTEHLLALIQELDELLT